jgi:hypothetical protein
METNAARPLYWLPNHVYGCDTRSGAVLLDLKRNRYFGLPLEDIERLAPFIGNWGRSNGSNRTATNSLVVAPSLELAEELLKEGLLSHENIVDDLVATQVDLDGMLTSVGREIDESPAIRFRQIVNFFRACLWARWSLRRRSLYDIAIQISREKPRTGVRQSSMDASVQLVATFRKLRPYAFAAKGQCLFHALALVRFMYLHGQTATWVFGVRTRPWAAHSWVQLDHLILDSCPEDVCEYTPILAI